MPYSLCRFDEVFGELVDGLVAVITPEILRKLVEGLR